MPMYGLMGTRPDVTPEEAALLRAAAQFDEPEPEVTVDEREVEEVEEVEVEEREPDRRPAPRRRRSDYTRRAALTSTDAERQAAGSLRKEVVWPFGLGVLVVIAAVAVIGLIADRSGSNVFTAVIGSALALTAGLVWWAGTILQGATKPAIDQLGRGLQEIEDGNYDVRLNRVGAAEFSGLAESFNRMATIVSHQRDRLKLMADTDGLTELSNHRRFYEFLRVELGKAKEAGTPLAVVTLDIDRFRRVNDDFGHARGDEVLRSVGMALKRVVREEDCVARLGGDDFAFALPGADPGLARDVAERAREAIDRTLPDNIDLKVSAGYVCFPQHTDQHNLTELAGSALALAKKQGGDRTQRYDKKQAQTLPTVREQREEIQDLLDDPHPITPVYQPLVELTTGRIVGYEALARFSERSPEAWFNQAHSCGLSVELEGAALRAALEHGDRPEGTYLSLNCSPSAISSGRVRSILPENLSEYVIEVTEHELASEDGALEHGIMELRSRGARIAVDDAGAGYAGLKQVMRVQPDIIKLDRSLIERVHADSAKAALVEFFVLFARRVGAAVCTEGIETFEELTTLIDLGVGYGQGYLLGRPSEPWCDLPVDLQKKLALGALKTHRDVEPPTPQGPMNRRLNRYHVVGTGRAARRAR
jgi:diguanylate cyclase (GGDEF)-like protein